MTTESTFQALLQLPEPWFIAGIDIDAQGEAMHVRIECWLRAPLACPQCGVACEVYDHAEARARAQQGDTTLKGSRQLWLYAAENVPSQRQADFKALKNADLQTAKAWAAKETLRRTWAQPDVAAARAHVQAWLADVRAHLPGPMLDFALLVKEKLEPIIRYCRHPISNGKAEGINSQLMAIQRSARGFRSHASFRIAALFHCGKLDLYPTGQHAHVKP